MTVSIFVIFLIFAFAFIFSPSNQKNKGITEDLLRKRYIIVICIIMILQSALRNVAVGADTYAYQLSFNRILITSWDEIYNNFIKVYVDKQGKDAGWDLLEKIFQLFSTEYRVFLFFIAITFFTTFGRFLYKNTSKINDVMFAFVLYMALFYAFFSITGLRQTFATSCALWGFEYIKQKRFLKYLIIILVAATIHKSVLLFLPFYFIANFKKPHVIYYLVLFLFPLLFYLKDQMAIFFISSTGSFYDYIYAYEDAGTYTFTTLFLIIYILGAISMKNILKKYPESYRLYNALSMALLFLPLTWRNPSAMRVVQYFSIFLLLFIPTYIDSIPLKKNNKRFIFAVIFALLIYLSAKTQGDYKFMWQNMPLNLNYY